MRRSLFIVTIGIAAAGCSRSGGIRSLAGDWSGSSHDSKNELMLAEDKTMYFFGANDFAAGLATGTYDQSADRLTLTSTSNGMPPLTFRYRWLGPDRVGLTIDAPGAEEDVYIRIGKAQKTASLSSKTPIAGGVPAATAPIDPAKLHESQMATTCLSNVKQLGMGLALYATDYDNTFPDSSAWAGGLYPYVKYEATFTCPSLAANGQQGGYAMDSRLSSASKNAVSSPENTIILFESTTATVGASDAQVSMLRQPRHADRINVAYVDGHAAALK